MRRVFFVLSLCAILAVATSAYVSDAQDATNEEGTPVLCPTPEGTPGTPVGGTPMVGTPVGSPEATPDIITEGSPEAIATSVVENIATGIEEVVCATPMASGS